MASLGLVLHQDAAVTLVRAIIEPIDRSMPPEMTTMAWATAAIASGNARSPGTGGAAAPYSAG